MAQPLHIRGITLDDGLQRQPRDLYTRDRVLPARPRGALTVDLEGCHVVPGAINAHDHLELNHFPRCRFRDRYGSAHDWGADMNARLDEEPFHTLRRYPLADRLLIGALKNLLSGATTVAHHNPPHRDLWRRGYPLRVIRRYGWAHSLAFASEDQILRSYRATPSADPWFIHLAEGTDTRAAHEYRRLKALGCVGPNTVLIHGVGLTAADIADAAPRVRGLVCCPTTNDWLLGATADIPAWCAAGGRWALGSDSCLTAAGDLRDEQQAAERWDSSVWAAFSPAQIVGAPDAGHLRVGALADWVALRRGKIALVVMAGQPLLGDVDLMARFPSVTCVSARLHDMPLSIQTMLARRIQNSALKLPGLEIDWQPSWFIGFGRRAHVRETET